jgi:hypothetical protein
MGTDLRPFQAEDREDTRRELRQIMRAPPLDADSAEHVLRCLANGMGITAIGNTAGLPAYWIINSWRRHYPEFDAACVQASEAGAEKLMWDTVAIADDVNRHPACREVSIRARSNVMRVLHRKRFDPATRVAELVGQRMADELSDADLARLVLEAQRAGEGQAPPDSPRVADPAPLREEPPSATPTPKNRK